MTVQALPGRFAKILSLITGIAQKLPAFGEQPLGDKQAAWALGAVLRHAFPEVPAGASPEWWNDGGSRLRLVPLLSVLRMPLHPDPKVATPFQEGSGHVEGSKIDALLQVARSDLVNGTEMYAWPGRLSNSELALQVGVSFPKNPRGIGGNA